MANTTRKAIFLMGAPGSGKDYLLRSTILSEIREIHLSKLNEVINTLSDSCILVNCNADDVAGITNANHILQETGYSTLGVFVYTTDQVSRERNEKRAGRGSRVIDEQIRQSKYSESKRALPHYSQIFNNFSIYDNSNSVLNEEIQGWLSELNTQIASFIVENAGGNSPLNLNGRTQDGRVPGGKGEGKGRGVGGESAMTKGVGKTSKNGKSFGTNSSFGGVNEAADGGFTRSNKVHSRRVGLAKKHFSFLLKKHANHPSVKNGAFHEEVEHLPSEKTPKSDTTAERLQRKTGANTERSNRPSAAMATSRNNPSKVLDVQKEQYITNVGKAKPQKNTKAMSQPYGEQENTKLTDATSSQIGVSEVFTDPKMRSYFPPPAMVLAGQTAVQSPKSGGPVAKQQQTVAQSGPDSIGSYGGEDNSTSPSPGAQPPTQVAKANNNTNEDLNINGVVNSPPAKGKKAAKPPVSTYDGRAGDDMNGVSTASGPLGEGFGGQANDQLAGDEPPVLKKAKPGFKYAQTTGGQTTPATISGGPPTGPMGGLSTMSESRVIRKNLSNKLTERFARLGRKKNQTLRG